jgi:hypothetical protein
MICLANHYFISSAGTEGKPSNHFFEDLNRTYEFCINNQEELREVLTKCQTEGQK